jgi:hypothetical protein
MTANPPQRWALTPVLRLTSVAMILTVAGLFAQGATQAILMVCGAGLAVAAAIKLVGHLKRKA